MFTLEAIKKKADGASFYKGNLYYLNDRVKDFRIDEKKDGRYEIRAAVRGSDIFQVFLMLDVSENIFVGWNCSCLHRSAGICKHVTAAAIYFLHHGMKLTEQKEPPEKKDQKETIRPPEGEDQKEAIKPPEGEDQKEAIRPPEKKDQKEAIRPAEGENQEEAIKPAEQKEGPMEHPSPIVLMSSGIDRKERAMVFDDLGLSGMKYRNDCAPSGKLVFIFDQFNLDSGAHYKNYSGQMQAARARRISLKIVRLEPCDKHNKSNDKNDRKHKSTETPEILSKARGIRVDRGRITDISGTPAFLLEYITANGVYVDGFYYIGQMNIDTLFAISAGIDEVYYGRPPQRLTITQEKYKPEIKLSSKNDGSVSIAFAGEITIIPGKYSTYILKDNKIMRLHESIPYSFIEKAEKKTSVAPGLRKALLTSVLPVLKEVVEIKDLEMAGLEPVAMKKVINQDISPGVNIYVKYSKELGEAYLLPEIVYGDYFLINPFKRGEIENFAAFHYRRQNVPDIVVVELEDSLVQFKRDVFKERSVYSTLMQVGCLEPDEDGRLLAADDDAFYDIFTSVIPGFPDDWKVFYDKEIEKIRFLKDEVSFDFDFSADVSNGLLEFDLEFHCQNLKISAEQLNDYITHNRRLLNIDGSFVEITNREVLQKLFTLLEKFRSKGKRGRYSGKLFNVTELDAILTGGDEKTSYRCSEDFKKMIREMKDGTLMEKAPIPESLSGVLRNYQKDGIQWICFLRKYGFGGILADDMGLGKTLQALAVLSMHQTGGISLIVCPKTLIHNWYNEIQKFSPGIRTLIACGGAAERLRRLKNANKDGVDLIITSYSLLQKDIMTYVKMDFEYCIIDEAQYIKNAATRTAKCAKAVKSKYRLALTGTPLENSVMDMWSLFDFVMPGFLGSESSFKAKYANMVPGENNSKLIALNRKVKPFLLRRTKKEMLKDLPPKIEQVGIAELTTVQLALYTKMLERIRRELTNTVAAKGFEKSRIEILAGLMRLRQICNHPGLANDHFIGLKDISGKMSLFAELLDECMQGGHKVLVFSQFVKMLGILKDHMDEKNIRYCYLDGQSRDREGIIRTFNTDSSVRVFLISLKAGGFGLNLTSADTVILYDPWWNPMVEEQASDRAHRIGQENTVNVYRLITKGTVEEKMQKLKERKKLLFDSLINESGDYMAKLSWEDLKEVLM